MNKDEEHDELWDLLGRARTPTPSPFFARNVVREVRALQQDRLFSLWRLLQRWQTVAAAVVVAAFAGGGWMLQQHQAQEEQQQLLALAEGLYSSPDYMVINELDELLDSDKHSVWLDAEVN